MIYAVISVAPILLELTFMIISLGRAKTAGGPYVPYYPRGRYKLIYTYLELILSKKIVINLLPLLHNKYYVKLHKYLNHFLNNNF